MINYLTTKNRLLVAILAFILPFSFARAEVKEDGKTISQGWYIGIEGGMPFGFSTFSSFGHDKTHLGWAAGLYGGYRFNSIFSAELSAKYGEMNLSAQDCCVERNYWLGSDGVLYKAGVLGMDSWEYANLKSHVRMGQYGARLNVNLLGLFHQTANSRWNLAVSPHKTLGFDYRKLSFQLVGTSKGIYMKQPKQIPFPSKSICFGIKVLYFGEDLKNTILFYSFDYCYGSCFI